MTSKQRETLEAAFIVLGQMGANTARHPYRLAWVHLRAILNADAEAREREQPISNGPQSAEAI